MHVVTVSVLIENRIRDAVKFQVSGEVLRTFSQTLSAGGIDASLGSLP